MKKKVLIFIIFIIALALIGAGAYYMLNKDTTKNTNKNTDTDITNTDTPTPSPTETEEEKEKGENVIEKIGKTTTIDLDDLNRKMNDAIENKGYRAIKFKCEINKNNEKIQVVFSAYELEPSTITTVINKLKEADGVKEVKYVYSNCPPKEMIFRVNKDHSQNNILTLIYSNTQEYLLLEYNNKQYAFHYKDKASVEGFIENLT